MTFLAPTALIFLFGIGIPVLIHFLNRFNVKKVKFSSVQFLKSMEDNSIRNVKFKKFILLMLRIGIISALVLMLSSCLLYTSPSPRDKRQSRMPSSA